MIRTLLDVADESSAYFVILLGIGLIASTISDWVKISGDGWGVFGILCLWAGYRLCWRSYQP